MIDTNIKDFAVSLSLAYAKESGQTADTQMVANMERAIKKVNELYDAMKKVDNYR